MNVALLGEIGLPEGDVRIALDKIAAQVDMQSLDVRTFDNALDLIESTVASPDEWRSDLVVCAQDSPGMTGLQIAAEIREISPDVRIVLVADDSDDAYRASQLDINGYLVKPIASAAFVRTMLTLIREIKLWHQDSVLIRFREQVRRIRLTDIMYAETSNHNQVIHMRDGSAETLRISSQALFDQLSHDGRFFKVGSSYIVNLNEVAETRGGVLFFVDGEQISVPVRVRKPLEDAMAE